MIYGITDDKGNFIRWEVIGEKTTVKYGFPQKVDTLPDFDPSTQKILEDAPVVESGNSRVRKTWKVVALSQDELNVLYAKDQLTSLSDTSGDDTEVRLSRLEKIASTLIKNSL